MPKVDGVEFPYTKAGMQKAQAWATMTGKPMQKEYQDGGTVHLRDTRRVIDPSTIQEVAHKPIESGTRQAVRYKGKTKGGSDVHMVKDIPGLTNKEWKRQLSTQALINLIKRNPDFGDTLSGEKATEFMNMEPRTTKDLLKLLLTLLPEDKDVLKTLQEVPKYSLGGWIKKRLTPPKKGKTLLNKLGHIGMGITGGLDAIPGVGLLTQATVGNISRAAACAGADDFWSCMEYGVGSPDKVSVPIKNRLYNPSGSPVTTPVSTGNFGFESNLPPLHTGITMDEQQLADWQNYIGDNTGLSEQEIMNEYKKFLESQEPPPEEKKSPKFWGFEKFGKGKKGNLQALVDEMLGDKPKKMQMGGPIAMNSMTPGRRMYNMPQRKKRPVMQTSTAGMPMRGMASGMPMMKKGGQVKMPKGWHV